ncbi:hypothetical protein OO013_13505 [Mangrovivirga sp. M17]|uniref:Uncharacterized protein n=1 Tax=Mangrovivirga halotolerans TaxID=2993936 RepID=A0ABT3RSX0_9BACT|nr:hypothetical protein [Mangrovivirga halotolerans]MCX2744893.1 hypothetical protein [Mangrovivirga halotolerans]
MENSNKSKGKFISKAKAKKEVNNFKKGNSKKPYAYSFDKEKIEKLLNQSGAEGLRVYLTKEDNGNTSVLMCAYDVDDNNIIPKGDTNEPQMKETTGDEQILNSGNACPPDCNIDPETSL